MRHAHGVLGVAALLIACGSAYAAPSTTAPRQRVRVLGEGEAITRTGEIVRTDAAPARVDLSRRRDTGISRGSDRVIPRAEPARHSQHPTTEDGTRSSTVTRDFADGTSITVDRSVTRDDGMLKNEEVVTLRDGRTLSKEVTWTHDGDTKTRESVVTAPDGSSVTHTDSWTRADGAVKHEGSTIRSDGQTSTRTSTLVRDGDTLIRDWERTGPNGTTRSGTTVRTSECDRPAPRRDEACAPLPATAARRTPAQASNATPKRRR